MQTPTIPSPDDLTKKELIELLKAEQAKSEFLHGLLVDISYEFRVPVATIMGYAHLILHDQERFFPELTELQTKSIESIKSAAERIQETLEFMMSKVQALYFVQSPPSKVKVVLTDLKGLDAQLSLVSTDLVQLPPIYADEWVVGVILDLLNFDLNIIYQNEIEISVIEEGNWIKFKYSNLAHRPLWLEDNLDSITNQLSCEDSFLWSKPFCLVIALVEKYGGAVYVELGSDSEHTLSFTLPVYREVA